MGRLECICVLAGLGVLTHLGSLFSESSAGGRVYAAGFVLIALTLGLALLLREGRELLRMLQVLAPLGILLLVDAVLGLLASWITLLTWSVDVGLGPIGLPLSAYLLASLLATSIAYVWVSLCILYVAQGDGPSDALLRGFVAIPSRFLRGLGVLFVGHALPLLVIALLIVILQQPPGVMFGFVILVAVATLLWNAWTATALLHVLATDTPWLGSMLDAMQSAWRHVRAWGVPMVTQLTLLGFVTIIGTSYNAQLIWVGAYTCDSKWFEAISEGSAPFLTAVLTLAGLFLAVAIKLRIARSLQRTPETVANS